MQSFKIIRLLVLKKKFFIFFTIYGHGGRLGHATYTIFIYFYSPFPMRLQIIWLLLAELFRGKCLKMVNDDNNDAGRRSIGTL